MGQGEHGDNWGVSGDNDPWEDYKLVPLFVALMYIGNVNCNIRGLSTIFCEIQNLTNCLKFKEM